MASFFRKRTPEPPRSTQPCASPGCLQPGEHKAPKSREKLNDYQWLCLDHVREFNKQWDYFLNFSSDDIEAFIKDAMLGHRPTWKMGTDPDAAHEALADAINHFFNSTSDQPRRKGSHPDPKVRKALSVMELEHPTTLPAIKAAYKILVKKYHPDLNQGDKGAEERFKQVAVANQVLLATYKT